RQRGYPRGFPTRRSSDLGLDPRRIVWRRAVDMNDRALRNIVIGLGGPADGVPRQDGFMITAASEVMAIFCLANERENLERRLGRSEEHTSELQSRENLVC